ncbi:Nucleoid occlusion factor SlmA [Sodalis glossinidius str. 'morsitans']|uniref:Nucleoid occlusion factor SlmA n=1 Tax=Sodalis glossinidius (strain morsitans) TaxID=343509 RepID=Q2NVE5_SODGM|nr:TetR family transcriptional regulator [Sodalis glossinidius]BAE73880.1 transcriptional regulator [Sodalis glossinidius str. 'morsitans']CRL44328.1 Nucleoid occlusion factor SlmA [Sodalis glossinidius str. 'morsitans']
MTNRQTARISSRKHPKQSRSTELVAAILQAATQVLAQEDAQRFTTARVAEKAGVSIGSLYQYFPNKAAILFRLQFDEWQQTTEMLRRILEEVGRPPLDRLSTLVHSFIQSECEEVAMRVALNDAASLYRDAPEAQQAKAAGDIVFQTFMREVLPGASQATLVQAGELITTTLSTVGHAVSENARSPKAVNRWAEGMADMFCAWLTSLQARQNSDNPTQARHDSDEPT